MCSKIKTERYVNFFTDFAFKKIFGNEENKDLVISFLNALLEKKEGKLITSVIYLTPKQLKVENMDRRSIFDIYCTDQNKKSFIVELQKRELYDFRDKSLFFSIFPFRQEITRELKNYEKDNSELPTNWNYEPHPVYVVGILDFKLKESESEKFVTHIYFKTEEGIIFNENLSYTYLETPGFNKKEDQLNTLLDKWTYAIKNLSTFDERPEILSEPVFKRFFELAEISNLDENEIDEYRKSLKIYKDYLSDVGLDTEG